MYSSQILSTVSVLALALGAQASTTSETSTHTTLSTRASTVGKSTVATTATSATSAVSSNNPGATTATSATSTGTSATGSLQSAMPTLSDSELAADVKQQLGSPMAMITAMNDVYDDCRSDEDLLTGKEILLFNSICVGLQGATPKSLSYAGGLAAAPSAASLKIEVFTDGSCGGQGATLPNTAGTCIKTDSLTGGSSGDGNGAFMSAKLTYVPKDPL